MALSHASFFSGVGGFDLGFERAGIKTVSFCENGKFASAVLASRWPGVPNLGDIIKLADRELIGEETDYQLPFEVQQAALPLRRHSGPDDLERRGTGGDDWRRADIWSGGFPCQDLSRAGKREGFYGERSRLAFTFLDLAEKYRPRWIVLENVTGALTSNEGRDFLRLISEMDQLGYGTAWRVLDARYFGVAQRRRRVFVVGSLGSDLSAEVLLECDGCERHPEEGGVEREKNSGPPYSRAEGPIKWVSWGRRGGPSDDSGRVREADGMAGRLDDSGEGGPKGGSYSPEASAGLLPPGMDWERWRACGNGVVSSVSEWIGARIVSVENLRIKGE